MKSCSVWFIVLICVVLIESQSWAVTTSPQPDLIIHNPLVPDHSGFGHSVVVEGNRLLVGAYGFDGAVLLLDGPGFDVEQVYEKPTGGGFAGFGAAASLNDNYVLVGGPFDGNVAWLFDRSSGAYVRPLVGNLFTQFGWSTGIDEDRLLVGAPTQSVMGGSGTVGVYSLDGILQQTLSDGIGHGRSFGRSLLVADNKLFIGAPDTIVGSHGNAGRVYLYEYDALSGYQLSHIFEGPETAINFGWSLAVEGDQLLVGTPYDDQVGAAHLYDLVSSQRIQSYYNPFPDHEDFFAESVAFVGKYVLVGAPDDDASGEDAGIAYLYDRVSGALVETFNNPSPHRGDRFGWKVGSIGDQLFISAEFDRDDGSAGTLYFYDGYVTVVPEPTTWMLGLIGLCGLLCLGVERQSHWMRPSGQRLVGLRSDATVDRGSGPA